MTWFRGSIARLPISLSSIRKAWATSIAEPTWVKVAPASKLQFTSILNVTMSWYEMHTLDAWSAAIHSRSSPGIVALRTFLLQVFPPSWLVLTVTFARLRLATYTLWIPFAFASGAVLKSVSPPPGPTPPNAWEIWFGD